LAQARAENAALKVQIVELEQRLAEWERVGKRQATPFARAEHTADPKKPGRKAGQGLFSYRTQPTPDEVDQTKRLDWNAAPSVAVW
jgi:transposase